MASIDRAAIVFSIAITAIGAGFAFVGDSVDNAPAPAARPPPAVTSEPVMADEPVQADPFAGIAERVKAEEMERRAMEEAAMAESMESMEMEIESMGMEPMEMEIEIESMDESLEIEIESMEIEIDEEAMEAAMEETVGDVMEEVMEEVISEVIEDVVTEAIDEIAEAAGPATYTVDIPAGTSVPGCEETRECYLPADITVSAGDTVVWTNSDTAAHTATEGSPTVGITGGFDSNLVLGGASYGFTFEEPGSYEYFCIVHPWMIGTVTVA